jgi:hypothetical protein
MFISRKTPGPVATARTPSAQHQLFKSLVAK